MKKNLLRTALIMGACMVWVASLQASIITSEADPALTGATVIDFTSAVQGEYSSLTIGDVVFTANDNHLSIADIYTSYGPVGNYLDNGTYSDMGFFDLTIDFSQPTSAFGFFWSMAEPDATWNLSAYDASDNLLETYLLPNTGPNQGTFVGLEASNIAYGRLINTSIKDLPAGNDIGYDWISIDNFTYKSATASVPEPSVLLLVACGLFGLAGIQRRLKK